jgi:hypothetical protein
MRRMLLAVAVALSREPGFCESYEPTRFEILALECAFTEDELRGVLRDSSNSFPHDEHLTSCRGVARPALLGDQPSNDERVAPRS